MIRAFRHDDGALVATDDPAAAVWIDLVAPSEAERATVSAVLGVALPTPPEMAEIEPSSRLQHRAGAAMMTALLPAAAEGDAPEMAPVTFILAGRRLTTLRHHAPRPFDTYPANAAEKPAACDTAEAVLTGLLEEIVDGLADVLERIGRDVAVLSHEIFGAPAPSGAPRTRPDFPQILGAIGRKGDLVSNILDSLLSLDRMLAFLAALASARGFDAQVLTLIDSLVRDTQALTEHVRFLQSKVNFLLDATLGLVSVEQNAIIKIFSVVAVAFLPPTLIASVYGMNFTVMPELSVPWAYPAAVAAMVASAVLPLLYFKHKDWL